MGASTTIIVSREPLSPWYVPSKLPHREEVLGPLLDYLKGCVEDRVRAVVHLVGPSGTGKTVMALSLAKRLEAWARGRGLKVKRAYLDMAWLYRASRCAYALAEELGLDVKAGMDPIEVLIEAYRHLKREDAWALVILDDVDRFVQAGGADFVYRLARWHEGAGIWGPVRYGLVLTHRDPSWLDTAEEPLKQSLIGRSVVLEPYGHRQVRDILLDRARLALAPDSYSLDLVDFAAGLAAMHGGPRYGLELILGAAELAEREGLSRVEADHVRRVHCSLRRAEGVYDIWDRPVEERLVVLAAAGALEAQRDKVYLRVEELETLYKVYCELYGVEPRGFQEALAETLKRGYLLQLGGRVTLEAPASLIRGLVERTLNRGKPPSREAT